MRLSIIFCIACIAHLAVSQPSDSSRGECPRSSPAFGVCTFNPEINCTGDDKCENGQICCPDGCNRSCKDPRPKEENKNKCPPAKPTFGACLFNPKVNCVTDTECNGGQVCCSDGCNKICKDPLTLPTHKPYIPPSSSDDQNRSLLKKCPPPTAPTFGACVFDASVNCLSDTECTNGQLCCPSGCNKICRNPLSPSVDPPRPPPSPSGRCPADTKKIFGAACVFDPKVNCVVDTECNAGQLCCSDGCGKICKEATTLDFDAEPSPSDNDEQNKCPAVTSPTIVGVCVFDSKVNCLDSSECRNGKICCPSGCNKICQNPIPTPVHSATKP